MDTGAKCRQCRREGLKLFLKGERCLTEKCAIERRSYPPGEHGRGRIKQSEYLLQLREKQKARRYYGLLEKQFRNTYAKASRRTGPTVRTLADARDAARQRRLPSRLCGLARAGAAARPPRALHGQRAASQHPELRSAAGRHRLAQAGQPLGRARVPATPPIFTAAVTPWLQADHDGLTGKMLKARACRDRHAGAGIPDRRALLEVRAWHVPPVLRPPNHPDSNRRKDHMATRSSLMDFQTPKIAPGRRTSARGGSRSSRSTAASATRSATRSGASCSPPSRGGSHGRQDRGRRRARVHDPAGRSRGRHRHHPEPQGVRLPPARRVARDRGAPLEEGAGAVTAADIEAPADLEILNPDLGFAHLADKGKLEMTLTIGRGRGYVPADQNRGRRSRSA